MERNLSAFLARIRKYRTRGLAAGVADCAIPNGADRALMQFLYEQDMLKSWPPTAAGIPLSNTLGTVLSHLCAWNAAERLGRLTGEAREASEEFCSSGIWRTGVYGGGAQRRYRPSDGYRSELNRLDLRDKEPVVREIVKKRLEEFQAKYFPKEPYRFELRMPWNRMFEVEISLYR